MKIQEFDPEEVLVDDAYRVRKGAPDPRKVEELATNMLTRLEKDQNPQIQIANVRKGEDGKIYIEDGEHRLLAIKRVNESLPAGKEPLKFLATLVQEQNRVDALLTSLAANHFRADMTIFDRGVVAEKLIATGMTQKEVAAEFGLKQGSISDALAAAKLPKKFQVLVAKGEMTEEGAARLARVTPERRDEMMQASIEYLEVLDAIEARKEKEAEEETASSRGKKGKTNPEVPKTKAKNKAKAKITGEVINTVARKRNAMKPSAAGKTKRELVEFLGSFFGPEVTEDIPKPARELAEAIETWLDGDMKDKAFKEKFLECCKSRYSSTSIAA